MNSTGDTVECHVKRVRVQTVKLLSNSSRTRDQNAERSGYLVIVLWY